MFNNTHNCLNRYNKVVKKTNSEFKKIKIVIIFCDPTSPQLELFLARIFKTYDRLKVLGFIYFNGAVTILEMEEDAQSE